MTALPEEQQAIKALHKRASESVKNKNIQDAMAALLEILTIDPRDFSTYFKLAQIYFAMKDYRQTEYMCQQAIISNPDDIRPWLILGNMYVATGDFNKMATQLSAGLTVNPSNFKLNYLVGYGCAKIGNFTKAKTHLEEAVKINPASQQAQQALQTINQAMKAKAAAQ